MMKASPDGPVRGHAPALEVELTKGPDGKLRSFRFSIGAAAILLLLVCLGWGAGDKRLPLLKEMVMLMR